MINFTFIALVFISFLSLITKPYISSSIYSTYAILQPKFLFPWTFPNIQFSYLVAVSVIISFLFIFTRKSFKSKEIFRKEYILLIMILILMYLSNTFSPFQSYVAGVSSIIVLGSITTIVVMYFFQVATITNSSNPIQALKTHIFIFICCVSYYIYWANERYLSGNWSYFKSGRLTGPTQGPYSDENILSVLIVMGLPFILNAIFYTTGFAKRIFFLFLLLGSWHTIFLFGSRGAFISTLVVMIMSFVILSKKDTFFKSTPSFLSLVKYSKIFIFSIFTIAIVTQAGTVLNRSNEIIEGKNNQVSEPVNPRINSWKVGAKLALDFPLLGVGPQRFQQASTLLYPGETIHVAHNTYLNFAANTGIPSAALFVYLLVIHLKKRKINSAYIIEMSPFLTYINDSIFLSIVGFIVCSIFLDLIIFEPIYFIFILSHSLNTLVSNQIHIKRMH